MRPLYDFLFKNISHHGSFLLLSYKWIGLGMGWVWDGMDLCAGLLYEHRFAMLIIILPDPKFNLESEFGTTDDLKKISDDLK